MPEGMSDLELEFGLQAMLDAAPDAMVGVANDGRILMANVQAELLFGSPREALIGRPVEVLVPDRFKEIHPQHRRSYFDQPRTRPMGAHLDLAGRRADGTEFPAEVSLSTIESEESGTIAIAAIRDTTERRKTEARFQQMLDAAPDAMIGVDSDGVIVMANARTETVFGYRRSELIGQHLEVLIPERIKDVHRTHRAGFFDAPRFRPMGVGLDLSGRRSDGTEFPAEISLSWLDTENGVVALGAIRDITDRRRTEEEARRAREEADRASIELQSAYRELQAFSYAVAHDLRAPLRAIDGFSEALVEDHGPALDAGAQTYLDRIRRNVQRMGTMIDSLLELSRLVRSTLDATEVDLSALVEDVLETLREADPGRKVTAIVQPRVVARGDRGLLLILIANLVSNAWKFTAPHPQARIEFGSRGSEEGRVFFMHDDGVGFDPRYAEKLFTPFQRLHADDFGGSGIGLATAERIVRRHGGRIWADGAVEAGATFYFTLGEASS
jgi:PAS domain S-box-containing protein